MKISIVGSTGLVGSRVTELLQDKYEIEELNSSNGFDITDKSSVSQLEKSDSEVVILMAAKANVDGCEEDKVSGIEGDAWKLNVEGPKNIGEVCKVGGKKLIYISTDFVFDGTLPTGESYKELDMTSAVNWYGQTKLEGEKIVQKLDSPWIIARIAYPYRAEFEQKNDFVRTIKSLLAQGKEIKAVTDHLMCPTYIDDIALALEVLIEKNENGIFHIVGTESVTPFDAAQKIAFTFDLDASKISPTTRSEFFKGKAARPYNLALNNDKMISLGVTLRSFEQGLKNIKDQI